ncbi:MAG: hydroxymethylbilane synthase [Actinomycetota bacterium]|nr:hydroxymethylbilane synthase [Actinomycetota bacterium]
MPGTTLRLATRGSPLARWQAAHVADLLHQRAGVDAIHVIVETAGDRDREAPLEEVGGQGIFVKEVQQAVLDGRADVAVHSAKDLPASVAVPGLVIGAVPERADRRDALVGATLAGLARGATVATGSARRRVQLAVARPDLAFVPLRGNLGTRLDRVGTGGIDAVLVAQAALDRLGHRPAPGAHQVLEVEVMIPQVGQGALALECRVGDGPVLEALGLVDHEPSHRELVAERAFLARLGGGCSLPVGATATASAGGGASVTGMLAVDGGRTVVRATASGHDLVRVGSGVAGQLLDQVGAAWTAAPGAGGTVP